MSISVDGTNGVIYPDLSVQNTAATGFGFKNRIINGQMVIDQRNAGASVTMDSSGVETYVTDRFFGGDGSDAVLTMQQVSDSPADFINSAKVTVTTADASIGSTQYAVFGQRIEGLNITDLNWGTANAKSVTLSFWVKSSVTGTFGGSLRNSAANRSYVFSYSISAANTWEQKSVTITGDTSGTWLTTNGTGIILVWSLGDGSSRAGTAGSWSANSFSGVTGQTQIISTLSATWQITGVQLDKGSTATSFDYRPYGTELALCQRYYAKLGANPQGSSTYQAYGAGGNTNVNTAQNIHLPYPQFMRASPTVAFSGNIGVTVNATYLNVSLATAYGGVSSSLVQTLSAAIGSAGQGAVLISNGDATAFISLTAEL